MKNQFLCIFLLCVHPEKQNVCLHKLETTNFNPLISCNINPSINLQLRAVNKLHGAKISCQKDDIGAEHLGRGPGLTD